MFILFSSFVDNTVLLLVMADTMQSPKYNGLPTSRSSIKHTPLLPYLLFVRVGSETCLRQEMSLNLNRPGLDLGNCSHNLAFRNTTDAEIECIGFPSNVIYNRLSKQLRVRNDNSSLVDGDVDIGAPKSKLLEKYCYTSVSPKCTGLVYTT